MSRSIEQIIKRQRNGAALTKTDLWELRYEFEKAVTAAICEQIREFAIGDMDPWNKVIKIAVSQLEEAAYDRGIEEGKRNV